MGYRDGLDTYRNKKKPDFRGVKHNTYVLNFESFVENFYFFELGYLYGMPEFTTLKDKDPNNVKFLSQNLNQS